jgi:hypothetical protein
MHRERQAYLLAGGEHFSAKMERDLDVGKGTYADCRQTGRLTLRILLQKCVLDLVK